LVSRQCPARKSCSRQGQCPSPPRSLSEHVLFPVLSMKILLVLVASAPVAGLPASSRLTAAGANSAGLVPTGGVARAVPAVTATVAAKRNLEVGPRLSKSRSPPHSIISGSILREHRSLLIEIGSQGRAFPASLASAQSSISVHQPPAIDAPHVRKTSSLLHRSTAIPTTHQQGGQKQAVRTPDISPGNEPELVASVSKTTPGSLRYLRDMGGIALLATQSTTKDGGALSLFCVAIIGIFMLGGAYMLVRREKREQAREEAQCLGDSLLCGMEGRQGESRECPAARMHVLEAATPDCTTWGSVIGRPTLVRDVFAFWRGVVLQTRAETQCSSTSRREPLEPSSASSTLGYQLSASPSLATTGTQHGLMTGRRRSSARSTSAGTTDYSSIATSRNSSTSSAVHEVRFAEDAKTWDGALHDTGETALRGSRAVWGAKATLGLTEEEPVPLSGEPLLDLHAYGQPLHGAELVGKQSSRSPTSRRPRTLRTASRSTSSPLRRHLDSPSRTPSSPSLRPFDVGGVDALSGRQGHSSKTHRAASPGLPKDDAKIEPRRTKGGHRSNRGPRSRSPGKGTGGACTCMGYGVCVGCRNRSGGLM